MAERNEQVKLYFIATIRNIDFKGTIGTRTVGYFEDLETAKKCVEENWGDIYEDGYYKYAVIEDVEPGLYQSAESTPIFFKWEGSIKDGKYQEIERPIELKGFFGFTIG